MTILFAIILVLVIIYLVPFLVYGSLSKALNMKPPGDSPKKFLISVFISKIGTASAFVLIYYFARSDLSPNIAFYALVWWGMFVLDELGKIIGPNYSWKEAVAGIVSETLYFPISAFVVTLLIRP